MNVITQNPIIYSNADGITEDELYKKVKSECGDPPGGAFAYKKKKAFNSCRSRVMSKNPLKSQQTVLKAESKGTPKPKKDETKTTEQTQTTTETTQDGSKGKKMLLIGGGVLVLIVIGIVVLKNRNK
jgi:hypothetical protein